VTTTVNSPSLVLQEQGSPSLVLQEQGGQEQGGPLWYKRMMYHLQLNNTYAT
jgi:hypothetical protein